MVPQDRRRLGDTPEDMLVHPRRRSIYDYIQQHPGVSLVTIKHALDIDSSTLENHLKRLRQVDLIEERPYSHTTLVYPKGKAPAWNDPVLLPPSTKHVARHVLKHPGVTWREMTEELGVSHTFVVNHMKRLVDAGLVQMVGEGQRVKYVPTPLLIQHESSFE